ncbi:MAG: GNAT family N-acetyltransferase [Candidatus Yanofskybacteria bacterium]|nr:GNAT family N-acetyltransferase [Candidatus Yanofskybacteria bacterium]
MLKFEPLSERNIEEATELAHSVFPEDAKKERKPGDAYRASLEPRKYLDFYKQEGYNLLLLEYYIAREPSDKIAGVTGFYQRDIDPKDIAWLGWYCVDPQFRGKGYGREILEWTIDKAKEKGFTVLKLWTTTDPNEAAAQILYEKLGFTVVREEDSEGYRTLYREKKL